MIEKFTTTTNRDCSNEKLWECVKFPPPPINAIVSVIICVKDVPNNLFFFALLCTTSTYRRRSVPCAALVCKRTATFLKREFAIVVVNCFKSSLLTPIKELSFRIKNNFNHDREFLFFFHIFLYFCRQFFSY